MISAGLVLKTVSITRSGCSTLSLRTHDTKSRKFRISGNKFQHFFSNTAPTRYFGVPTFRWRVIDAQNSTHSPRHVNQCLTGRNNHSYDKRNVTDGSPLVSPNDYLTSSFSAIGRNEGAIKNKLSSRCQPLEFWFQQNSVLGLTLCPIHDRKIVY